MVVPRYPRGSGEQALAAPAAALARIDDAVVQAERPILPELDALRQDAIARPVRRARHRAIAEARCRFGDALFEHSTAGNRARLIGGPGADLAEPRPRREIGIRLGRRHRLDRPFDTY